MKINTQIDPSIPISKYSHDIIEDYELSKNVPWVAELLSELEEENDKEEVLPETSIRVSLQLSRKTNNFLGDHLIMRTQVNAQFSLPCGRCLAPLAQNMDFSFSAAFLHDSKEKMPEYAEVTTVFADNEEMELYFYHKGMADIHEVIHEQVFMEVAPFPRCSGDCKNPVLY